MDNMKTLALTGSEEKAEFSGGNAWLRNDGTDTIYAAKSAGVAAGADGVIAIPAGQSAPVYGANGTVYLLGTGSVQLIGSDYSTNPFKTSAQSGGSGADSVARAAISAHAGNTDIHVTAAEKAIWNDKADLNQTLRNLTFWSEGDIKDKSLASASGFVFVGNEVTGMPYDNTYWFASIEHTTNHCKITATDINNHRKTFNIVYSDTLKKWDEWINIADGGNADTLNGLHANEIASNPNLLINPDFRINQRGENSYNVTGCTADCWLSQVLFEVTPLENGIRISCVKEITSNSFALYQRVPVTDALHGSDLTMTANIASTSDYAYMAIYAYGTSGTVVKSSNKIKLNAGLNSVTLESLPDSTAYIRAQFTINTGAQIGDSLEIAWAKLEVGSTVTPFVPPDPIMELLKCQRYYQIRTTNDVDPLDLRPSMRTITDIKQVTGGYAYVAEL